MAQKAVATSASVANNPPNTYGSKPNPVTLLLLMGLGLRLFFVMLAQPDRPALYGGDAVWFLANGYGFLTFQEFGAYQGFAFTTSNLPIPPLYFIFVGIWLHLMETQASAIVMIWLLQVIVGVATCALAYGITMNLTQDRRASLIVLAVHVFSPPFITDALLIMSEPLYLFFIYAGLWLYGRCVMLREGVTWWLVVAVGIAFGLASLTRAVSLLFPVFLMCHAIFIRLGGTWRRGVRFGVLLMLTYAVLVGTWTAHNWFFHGRFIIGSDQFMPAMWRGTVELGISPQESDERLADTTPQAEVIATLTGDLGAYLRQRARQLSDAVLEPYSVAYIGGDVSMRALVLDWLRTPADLAQLWALLTNPNFWIKLYIYILHYAGLLAMPFGIWLLRHRWQMSVVLLGFVAYTLALHFITLATPRYIFPTYTALWALSAIVYSRLWLRRFNVPAHPASDATPA